MLSCGCGLQDVAAAGGRAARNRGPADRRDGSVVPRLQPGRPVLPSTGDRTRDRRDTGLRLVRRHAHPLPKVSLVTSPWDPSGAGVVQLPSGRLVRGRSLRRALPAGPWPTFAVYLLSRPPPTAAWEACWVRWPDFLLPSDGVHARNVLREAWERAPSERVEIACGGGRGRTGTALACLAVIDGLPAGQAVAFIRQHYDPRAVETPWQKRYVTRFPAQRRSR